MAKPDRTPLELFFAAKARSGPSTLPRRALPAPPPGVAWLENPSRPPSSRSRFSLFGLPTSPSVSAPPDSRKLGSQRSGFDHPSPAQSIGPAHSRHPAVADE